MAIDLRSLEPVLSSLKPLEVLNPLNQVNGNSSGLAEFAAIFAQASAPATHSHKLMKDYMKGKPVNIDEVKIAQMEEAIATDLTVKTVGKIVHSIETISSMQI